jgi:hypothetical protein
MCSSRPARAMSTEGRLGVDHDLDAIEAGKAGEPSPCPPCRVGSHLHTDSMTAGAVP